MEKVKIFLSYCWNDSDEADKIYDYFSKKHNIEIWRDTIKIEAWRSIKEYMQSINNTDYAILLISESYLKSVNCMYEVLEVMKNRDYKDKIFPVVICLDIYKSERVASYVKYWENEYRSLERILKNLNIENSGNLVQKLKQLKKISLSIADFLVEISDMNIPSTKNVCVEIDKKIKAKNVFECKEHKNQLFISNDIVKTRIVVVAVGGAGINIINRMIDANVAGVEFVGIDTDKKALQLCRAPKLIQIGENLIKGAGTDAKPEIGEKAAKESCEEIVAVLKDIDMAFIICGMGGGTGTGAAPVVAKLSKAMDILTIGIVTRPFSFENRKYINNSIAGINRIIDSIDSLIVISNDNFQDFIDKHFAVPRKFSLIDEIFLQVIEAIVNLLKIPAVIKLDFEDVRVAMKDKGIIYFGLAKSRGEDKARNAAKIAAKNPFLETTVSGATHVLMNISGDISLWDASEAASYVQEITGEDVSITFSAMDNKMELESCEVLIIAAGMD